MNKRRLLKLADLLDADAKNKNGVKFDMGLWGYVDNPAKPISCGTSACAMGLAALSGTFKREGLTASISKDGAVRFVLDGKKASTKGRDIACKFFDIDNSEARALFLPGRNGEEGAEEGAEAERAKAKQIRKFVATGIVER